jgi:alkylhydroperoxidase family enzyme
MALLQVCLCRVLGRGDVTQLDKAIKETAIELRAKDMCAFYRKHENLLNARCADAKSLDEIFHYLKNDLLKGLTAEDMSAIGMWVAKTACCENCREDDFPPCLRNFHGKIGRDASPLWGYAQTLSLSPDGQRAFLLLAAQLPKILLSVMWNADTPSEWAVMQFSDVRMWEIRQGPAINFAIKVVGPGVTIGANFDEKNLVNGSANTLSRGD